MNKFSSINKFYAIQKKFFRYSWKISWTSLHISPTIITPGKKTSMCEIYMCVFILQKFFKCTTICLRFIHSYLDHLCINVIVLYFYTHDLLKNKHLCLNFRARQHTFSFRIVFLTLGGAANEDWEKALGTGQTYQTPDSSFWHSGPRGNIKSAKKSPFFSLF